jgi:hypothetical protein
MSHWMTAAWPCARVPSKRSTIAAAIWESTVAVPIAVTSSTIWASLRPSSKAARSSRVEMLVMSVCWSLIWPLLDQVAGAEAA